MSNLESALMGTPALAYAVGGVPFVINSGKSGYLATLGDWPSLVEPILKYIASDNDYLILQQTCIKDMQSKFSIDSISNMYQKLYQ
jgi:glycosyltransferase involved in cell wall biosynthesis